MNEVMVFEDQNIDILSFQTHTEKYFGISIEHSTYTQHIKYFVKRVDNVGNQQNIFTLDELLHFVKKKCENYNKSLLEILVSKTLIDVTDVTDIFNKKIFENQSEMGWLVFIDPCTIANWSHSCEYWFVVNADKVHYKREEMWPPSESIKCEEFNGNTFL